MLPWPKKCIYTRMQEIKFQNLTVEKNLNWKTSFFKKITVKKVSVWSINLIQDRLTNGWIERQTDKQIRRTGRKSSKISNSSLSKKSLKIEQIVFLLLMYLKPEGKI